MGRSQPRRLEEHIAYEMLVLLVASGLALVQVSLLPAPLGFPPAFVLVVGICRILLGSAQPDHGMGVTLRGVFYAGMVLDVCSAAPLGSHAIALLVAILLVFAVTITFHTAASLLMIVSVFFGGIAYESVLAGIYAIGTSPLQWSTYIAVIMLPSVVITVLLAVPMCFLLRWVVYGTIPFLAGDKQKRSF